MENSFESINQTITAKAPRKFRWWKFWLVFILICAFLVYYLFFRSYSDGFRDGFIVKLSKKGYIFKTWEGQMRLNTLSLDETDKYFFSVADEKIADQINKLDKRKYVRLRYKEYLVVPFWRGDTKYFIDQIEILQDIPSAPQTIVPVPR